MTQNHLVELIKRPEVQQMILRDYEGAYSIGLTLNPANRGEIAVRVRVEGDKANEIPSQVVLEGEAIPVIVNTDFQAPAPLPKMQARV
jgi:hypothetical protein